MSEADTIHIIIQKFEPLLKELSERELVVLNKMVVERLRLMHKAESLLYMTKFNAGDSVSWTGSDGIIRYGVYNKFVPDSNHLLTSKRLDRVG